MITPNIVRIKSSGINLNDQLNCDRDQPQLELDSIEGIKLTELELEIEFTDSNLNIGESNNNSPCSSCRPEQSVFVPSPSGRIGITCTWHQKHRPRWRHRLQVPLRLQLEDGRKSNDMDQGKNPVEEGWKFLQNAKKLTSRTLTSHTKGNNRTPT